MSTELERERIALTHADRDLREGAERLARQERLTLRLEAAGHDVADAVRLTRILRETLAEWQLHRSLIVQRIEMLENREKP